MYFLLISSFFIHISGCYLINRNKYFYKYVSFTSLIVFVSTFLRVITNRILGEELVLAKFAKFTIAFKVDVMTTEFAFLLLFLWPLAFCYSVSYYNTNKKLQSQLPYIMVGLSISIPIALLATFSANLITMFIFYELLSLVTLPLIGMSKSPETQKALKVYFFTLCGSAAGLLLPAIFVIYKVTGTLDFQAGGIFTDMDTDTGLLLLILFLYGTSKTALWPLHTWLPKAMVADYPISALLHAVAVVKIGIICLLKVCSQIFGSEYLQSIVNDHIWILVLPIIGILYSSFKALIESNIKTILAYSTISQLSLMVLIILGNREAGGVMALIYSHALAKITMFYTIGYIYLYYQITRVEELHGLNSKNKLLFITFSIASLSLAGFPMLPGYYCKYVAMASNTNMIVETFAIISTMLTVAYVTKMLWHIYVPSTRIISNTIPISRLAIVLWCMLLMLVFSVALYKVTNNISSQILQQLTIMAFGVLLSAIIYKSTKPLTKVADSLNVIGNNFSQNYQNKVHNWGVQFNGYINRSDILSIESAISISIIMVCGILIYFLYNTC